MMRIVFFNTSYMKHYKGKQNDELIGSFRFVTETSDGMEKYNFQPTIINGQKMILGFVEAGFTKGGFEKGNQKRIHIEKIIDSETPIAMLKDVLVVWCAKLPDSNHTAVMGWHKNATVFSKPIKDQSEEFRVRSVPGVGYMYNVKAEKDNCVLLPEKERYKSSWVAYRKQQNNLNFGFGQSNIWYAKEESAQHYVEKLINQIEQYNGENWIYL